MEDLKLSITSAKRGEVSCLMAPLPDSPEIKALQDLIPEDALYEPNNYKYGREEHSHITVLFGIVTEEIKPIQDTVQDIGTIKITFEKKISIFSKDEYDVVKVGVESKQLTKMNKALTNNLVVDNDFPDYKPHLTIAYVKKGLGKDFDGLRVELPDVEVTELEFSDHAEKKTEISVKEASLKLAWEIPSIPWKEFWGTAKSGDIWNVYLRETMHVIKILMKDNDGFRSFTYDTIEDAELGINGDNLPNGLNLSNATFEFIKNTKEVASSLKLSWEMPFIANNIDELIEIAVPGQIWRVRDYEQMDPKEYIYVVSPLSKSNLSNNTLAGAMWHNRYEKDYGQEDSAFATIHTSHFPLTLVGNFELPEVASSLKLSLELPGAEQYPDTSILNDPQPDELLKHSPTVRKENWDIVKYRLDPQNEEKFFEKGLHQTIDTPQITRPIVPYGSLELKSWEVEQDFQIGDKVKILTGPVDGSSPDAEGYIVNIQKGDNGKDVYTISYQSNGLCWRYENELELIERKESSLKLSWEMGPEGTTYKLDVQNWSTRRLIPEFLQLEQCIEKDECFGVRDITLRSWIEEELVKRDIDIESILGGAAPEYEVNELELERRRKEDALQSQAAFPFKAPPEEHPLFPEETEEKNSEEETPIGNSLRRKLFFDKRDILPPDYTSPLSEYLPEEETSTERENLNQKYRNKNPQGRNKVNRSEERQRQENEGRILSSLKLSAKNDITINIPDEEGTPQGKILYRKDKKNQETAYYYDQENKLHNDRGPALISPKEKAYYQHGYLHNEEGPARILSNGTKEYWLHGKPLSQKEWELQRHVPEGKEEQRSSEPQLKPERFMGDLQGQKEIDVLNTAPKEKAIDKPSLSLSPEKKPLISLEELNKQNVSGDVWKALRSGVSKSPVYFTIESMEDIGKENARVVGKYSLFEDDLDWHKASPFTLHMYEGPFEKVEKKVEASLKLFAYTEEQNNLIYDAIREVFDGERSYFDYPSNASFPFPIKDAQDLLEGACWELSHKLVLKLKKKGIPAKTKTIPMEKVPEQLGYNKDIPDHFLTHSVVELEDGRIIDLTAGQYNKEYLPLVQMQRGKKASLKLSSLESGWYSPSGQFFSLASNTHTELAYELIEEYCPRLWQDFKDEKVLTTDLIPLFLQQGWVRLMFLSGRTREAGITVGIWDSTTQSTLLEIISQLRPSDEVTVELVSLEREQILFKGKAEYYLTTASLKLSWEVEPTLNQFDIYENPSLLIGWLVRDTDKMYGIVTDIQRGKIIADWYASTEAALNTYKTLTPESAEMIYRRAIPRSINNVIPLKFIGRHSFEINAHLKLSWTPRSGTGWMSPEGKFFRLMNDAEHGDMALGLIERLYPSLYEKIQGESLAYALAKFFKMGWTRVSHAGEGTGITIGIWNEDTKSSVIELLSTLKPDHLVDIEAATYNSLNDTLNYREVFSGKVGDYLKTASLYNVKESLELISSCKDYYDFNKEFSSEWATYETRM